MVATLQVYSIGSRINLFCQARNEKVLHIKWSHQNVGGEAEGCTVVLKGGTISMPTGRHVDNDFIPGLKTKTDF
jgi:hypothetical protein